MIILAVDTAAQGCSVAITDSGAILSEITLLKKETHSKHLMSVIDSVLSVSGLDLNDIDGFAVTKGPGSFTGLRIGISTIKGLSAVTGKPVVGISSLDAIASALPVADCDICTMIDARKGEVYTACYSVVEGILKKNTPEHAMVPADILNEIHNKTIFVGTGVSAYYKLICEKMGSLAVFVPDRYNMVSAAASALISIKKFESGETDDPAFILPQYLRKPDAELNLEKKR